MIDTLLLKNKTKLLITLISEKKIDELFEHVSTIMTKEDILRVFDEDYPGEISVPSNESFNNYNLTTFEDTDFCIVEFNLWYDDKESDMIASFYFYFEKDKIKNIEFHDLRVF